MGRLLLLQPALAVQLDLGHVGGELDHPHGLPVRIEDRIVGRLNPDFAATLGEAEILAGQEFAAVQGRPERLVI